MKSTFVTNVLSPRHEDATTREYVCIMPVLHITLSWVASRDHRVMVRLNHWRPPKWLRMWMLAATRVGDGGLWYALGLAVALYGGPQRFRALLAATLAVAAGVALFLELKRLFRRKRPCALEPHCWAELLPPDQFSFPSGHTITAFAVTAALAGFYPEMLPGLIFCAISIAASRVVLGMHFLSDVVVGAALGVTLGSLAAALVH
jgi:undecaprenyl-diphosphatase